jgi:site-specific DNA-methyltransferase (adenine-specific)
MAKTIHEPAAEWVETSALTPWAKNPRNNDHAVAAVADSIKRFGFAAPIVARRANGEIIAGHTRLKAAMRLGLDRVPVRYIDVDPADAHLLAVADNKLSEAADWDQALLLDVLSDYGLEDAAVAGFDSEELERIGAELAATDVDTVDRDDDVAGLEAEGPYDSKVGEIYRLGEHILVCGDSSDADTRAAALECRAPRLWFVDPPFDLTYQAWPLLQSVDVAFVWHRSKDGLRWMADTFADDAWGVHSFVFTGGIRGQHNHTLPCCMHENVAVWRRHWWTDKLEAIDRDVVAASGCIATSDGRPRSWQENSGGVLTGYEGMSWGKPVMQAEIGIAYSPRGCDVVDWCAGSGTTLIASAKHRRRWVGCELQPKWADLIRRRWTRWADDAGVDPGPGALSPPA